MTITIDWQQIVDAFTRMSIAFLLALPLAIERGQRGSGIGLRTFPIVAMAACGYVMLVTEMPGSDAESLSRLLQGLLAGIGFIGGGAILKDSAGSVHGVVTAASIWNTGAIGAAVALDRLEIAVVLSVLNILTLMLLGLYRRRHGLDSSVAE